MNGILRHSRKTNGLSTLRKSNGEISSRPKWELETDPIFRMTTVITTLYELMGDREDIFGSVPAAQVREAYAIGQVLERLLSGLVPLRGRIVDYEVIRLEGRELLAHRTVRDQLGADYSDVARPVYVTGVAHHGLFWKDIRQVLFSGAQYNAFCRLSTEGLKEDWQPIKVADMFEGVIADFKAAINNFSEIARVAMEGQGKGDATDTTARRIPRKRIGQGICGAVGSLPSEICKP